ncbi:N-acetylmuramoyl-L-alanine amidase [Halopseudomonas sp.]|uniref:N-acetylmuramoyl-L-alanine amidase n=1 Tax=Halopseudomonas sp. TaxID=2901191 RepID=UPI0035638035
MLRRLTSLFCLSLLLGGCAPMLEIDASHSSANHDSRVQYVIVHYTSSGFDRALMHLTRGEVSSHYLISEQPTIYRLVDENRRAWHTGDSSWQGRTWLNASSIGIEIVHPGYTDTAQGRIWHPWPREQIEALIPLLQDILRRHQLTPDRVLGHSDVAPQRKVDPGPLFPWQQLAEAGVAIWPEAAVVTRYRQVLAGRTPPPQWFEMALQTFGYRLEISPGAPPAARKKARQNVIAAFQMRFRPARHDGVADAETAAILAALVPATTTTSLWCIPVASASPVVATSVLPTSGALPACSAAETGAD